MSLPTTALANVRVIESWIDRPFTDFGDTTTKVYYLRCHCAESDYTSLALGTANLTNATTAGVIATRYADATARWVGDLDFKSSDGGYMTFIRRFANVPADYVDYTSTVVTLPDGSNSDTVDENGQPSNIVYPGGDYSLTARVEYKFSTDPTSIVIVNPFIVTWNAITIPASYYAVGDAVTFTTPSRTDISTAQLFDSGTERASEATQITRWMGDIYMSVTPYVTPDDIKDTPAP